MSVYVAVHQELLKVDGSTGVPGGHGTILAPPDDIYSYEVHSVFPWGDMGEKKMAVIVWRRTSDLAK